MAMTSTKDKIDPFLMDDRCMGMQVTWNIKYKQLCYLLPVET